jgi:hypothetical protein
MFFVTLAVLSLAATDCGVAGARAIVDFDILQPPRESFPLPRGLKLTFEGEDAPSWGYDIVARGKPSDYNLLHWAPHGPDRSDLFAWLHFNRVYPDIRRLSLRRHRGEVVLDLRDVHSVVDPEADALAKARGEDLGGMNSAKFTGGTVHVCWLDPHSK